MDLRTLFQGINIKNQYENKEILGISQDSRTIQKGYLYVAIQGTQRDGNDYVFEAVKNGAVAVLTDKMGMPYIQCDNAREALALIWKNYYENPTKNMKVIGVTGTNGKTSTCFFLYSILQKAKIPCGLITTIKTQINGETLSEQDSEITDVPSQMTTPDSKYLYKILKKMEEKGVKIVVLEVSSHAIAQRRIDGIRFDVALFTNLSAEHMDFHKTIDDYLQTKAKLFERADVSIVNQKDFYSKEILKHAKQSKTCGIEGSDYPILSLKKEEGKYSYFLNDYRIRLAVDGEYMIENSALAVACADSLGLPKKAIEEGVFDVKKIDGRMEKIAKNIYIDYAHTPYAMEKVLQSAKREFPNRKIIVLFGCGGNRDREKRPKMGKIATENADFVYLTSDNARDENPSFILSEILREITNENYAVIPNRKQAIEFAVTHKKDEEVLLLLGKGHEQYEISKGEKKRFNEKEIVCEVLKYDSL